MKKSNELVSEKIQKLIVEDKIDEAIIELSMLANYSHWMREEIMTNVKFDDITDSLLNGTLNIDETAIQESRVKDVILLIASRIDESKNRSFETDVELFEQRSNEEELIANVEFIYKILSSIVIEVEEILLPLFTNNYDIEEVRDRIVLLFKTTRNRGCFNRWIIYLNKQLELNSFSNRFTKTVDDLVFILDEIFFNYFYKIVPKDIGRDDLYTPINYLQNEYPPNKNFNGIHELTVNIIKLSQNSEIREIQRIASRYLYEIRCAIMDFEGLIEID